MTLAQRLLSMFGQKESLARTALVERDVGKAKNTPINYENLARTGYMRSNIAYTCVSKIAGSTRSFKWYVYQKDKSGRPKELEQHPLLELWGKPNPMTSTADLVENALAFYLLTGNSYLEANRGAVKTGIPLELWNVRPDKMKIVPGKLGYPAAFEFSFNGITRTWEVDVVKMKSDILHWKTFHPLDDWYGMAPLQAAMLALDQNLAGQTWNLALLQNSATPSGVLQVKISDANPRGELTDEQYKRMRQDYESNYQGVKNTGKPMIIEGGLTWTQMSHSPKDVDYSKGKEMSATDICLVYNIPPEVIGLGQKTFNNYREARLAMYEEAILPVADSFIQGVNRWLGAAFGEDVYLDYDRDSIDVLVWKREQKYQSLGQANFLTQNEKREAVGYEPEDGWDVYVIGNQVGAMPEDFSGGTGTSDSEDEPGGSDVPEEGNPEDEEQDKPKPGAEEGEEENPDDESANDGTDENPKGWKSINLLNDNEKRSSWRAQNRRRAKHREGMGRDLKGDFKELISKLKKVDGNRNDARLTEFALLKILGEELPEIHKTLKRHIRYTLEDFGGAILGEGKQTDFEILKKANLKFDHYVNHYTETRSGAAIKSITQTSTKVIKRVVGEWVQTAYRDGDSNAELSKFIEAEFEELTPSMATRIARTEVAMASNNGALEAVKSLQIPNMFKEWITANDDRVRDGHDGGADHGAMNGAEVGLDEKFGVPPDTLMEGPGDNSAPADQVINCRCVLVYRSKN